MNAVLAPVHKPSLVGKFANKYSIESDKLLSILKATAFKQKDVEVTNEQMAALLVVADQYGLNPFTKEIFAFPDKQNGIVPVVGVDGWSRIINDHPQSDGFEFRQCEEMETLADAQPCPKWIEIVIYRKDRSHPIVVREYLDEVYRPLGKYSDGNKHKPGPWQTHTKRFLRHKTLIQGARIAYGFGGIYDEDEAERIVERNMGPAEIIGSPTVIQPPQSKSKPEPDAAAQGTQGQQPTAPASSAAANAPLATGANDSPPAAAAPAQQGGTTVSDSVLRIFKAKMENASLGEADLRKKFGHGYDGVTKENYNALVDWIGNPAA